MSARRLAGTLALSVVLGVPAAADVVDTSAGGLSLRTVVETGSPE